MTNNTPDPENQNASNILPVIDLIQAIHDGYKNGISNYNYMVRINNDQYKIYDTNTDQLKLSLPARNIIPLKTAAVSMLAIQLLLPAEPQHAAIYGIGKQAQAHIQALLSLYPNIIIDVIAKTPSKSLQFAQSYADRRVRCTRIVFPEVDLVITATNSKRPVYSLQAEAQRLVIGIGAQDTEHLEIGRNTIQKSTIYTDDINRAKSFAGDLIKAEINWDQVQDLTTTKPENLSAEPKLFKNMGAAIWDPVVAKLLIENNTD